MTPGSDGDDEDTALDTQQASREEFLDYLGELVGQLSQLTQERKLGLLTHLLAMVAMQADLERKSGELKAH